MPLFKEKWPLEDSLLAELRNKFFEDPSDFDKCHADDLKRVKENDWFLARYLLHNDRDVSKALLMLRESLKYRKVMELNTLRKKDIPEDYFKTRCVHLYNKDIRDHPIVAVRCKIHVKIEETKRLQQQYMLYWVDKGIRSSDWGVVSILFDCTDSRISNMDLDMIRVLFDYFKKYSPWSLGWFIVYNMPWYMSAFWKIVKQWVPARYVEKVCFVDSNSIREYISIDQLPLCIGGTSTKQYENKEGIEDSEESE